MTATRRGRPLVAVAMLAVAALGGASAAGTEVNAVTRHMESIEVGQGAEHRLVVVHLVIGRSDPKAPASSILLGGSASPDLIAFGHMDKAAKPKGEAVTFTTSPTILLAGDVLRTDTADFAVARDAIVPAGETVLVPFLRISREIEPDPKAIEPTMLGQVLPSQFRYLLLTDATGAVLRDEAERLADEVRLPPGRRSPADLDATELLAKRGSDYRRHLATLGTQPLAPGREVVGCAVLVNGALSTFETFGDGRLFAAAWPRLAAAVAAEASLEEARVGLLTEDLPDSADPDRYLTDVKKRLLDVFGARVDDHDVREGGRGLELSLTGAVARALVLGDRVVHFVLVTDPAHRRDKKPTEGPDPQSASRKAHKTEEEKRLLERRGGGGPLPQPQEPPPPPR